MSLLIPQVMGFNPPFSENQLVDLLVAQSLLSSSGSPLEVLPTGSSLGVFTSDMDSPLHW